ncbi:MAG: protein kinase, partial [bacterium]|nr:protein kinase [bacterium]
MDDAILPKLLDRLSKVSIIDQLKEGGQKTVYRAHHADYGDVVLKVVVPSDNAEKERALREIHIASSLTSDLFSRLYDFGEFADNGTTVLYIVEELLPGDNLRDIMTSYAPNTVPIAETRRIMNSIMEALTITAPLNLVHRDIKPENI